LTPSETKRKTSKFAQAATDSEEKQELTQRAKATAASGSIPAVPESASGYNVEQVAAKLKVRICFGFTFLCSTIHPGLRFIRFLRQLAVPDVILLLVSGQLKGTRCADDWCVSEREVQEFFGLCAGDLECRACGCLFELSLGHAALADGAQAGTDRDAAPSRKRRKFFLLVYPLW